MTTMKVLVMTLALGIAGSALAQPISEDFDDVGGATSNGQGGGANLEAQGWYFKNESDPLGGTYYYQGIDEVFLAYSTTGYLAANYNNTGDNGTISNWCMLPERLISDGDTISFYTRTISATYPDRLQVRLSRNGSSTETGAIGTGTGDFSYLLLDINPNYIGSEYPQVWTRFDITVNTGQSPAMGRIAFRYFVEDGGYFGINSNYIGIDELRYTPAAPQDATISGTVLLQNLDGDEEGKSVVMEIRQGGNVVDTETVTLGAGGAYSFTTTVTGTADVACKGSTWLRKVNSGLSLSAGGTTNTSFSLVNGDCDDDNEVNIVDAGILSATFGKSEGDTGYDARGDLDCDGEVTLVDAGILAANFGQGGDE